MDEDWEVGLGVDMCFEKIDILVDLVFLLCGVFVGVVCDGVGVGDDRMVIVEMKQLFREQLVQVEKLSDFIILFYQLFQKFFD